jgi:hypothetical protein
MVGWTEVLLAEYAASARLNGVKGEHATTIIRPI